MITIQFLAEWKVRSLVLIAGGAMLRRVGRVRDSSIRLAACIAMPCRSMAIPLPVSPTVVRPVADAAMFDRVEPMSAGVLAIFPIIDFGER